MIGSFLGPTDRLILNIFERFFKIRSKRKPQLSSIFWLPGDRLAIAGYCESDNQKYTQGDPYHCYHFNCDSCGNELTGDSQEYLGKLLCRRCHDKSEIPICGACRRPIEGRVVRAMDKSWHVEHFVCHHCEKPFLNDTYFIGADDGKPYCEYHYNKLFGDSCTWCGRVIQSQVIAAFDKRWCAECFQCYTCNKAISPREKFIEYDMKPICKKCFDHFPYELKKRLKKGADCFAKDRKTQIKNEKKAS